MEKILFLLGDPKLVNEMTNAPVKAPFADDILDFLSEVSREIRKNPETRQFSDVATFAFWIRRTSLENLKRSVCFRDDRIYVGKGVAFHIAPSNVPVNFAYSLVTGLLTGNKNLVRVPTKDFPQVELIISAFRAVLQRHASLRPYILLVRYGHDREINDQLSQIADLRVIWGGDQTIQEIRKSPLPPRGMEITFADRYSIAVVDSDAYLSRSSSSQIAEAFFNDTYLSDQNACTSPRIVVWTGSRKKDAKELFWDVLHKTVKERYRFQDIQGVNKLTSAYLAAASIDGAHIIPHSDNLLVRVSVPKPEWRLMELKDNSGYFFETECDDVMELRDLCDDKRCQTIAMLGDKTWLRPLLESGIKGVDRVTELGHSMDFSLLWDGHDLVAEMTRGIAVG